MDQFLAAELWDGTTVADLLSVDFFVSVAGSVLAAIVILIVGFWLAGWIKNRICGLADRYKTLDETLFDFLGSIARYTVICLTFLFVLNTFGFQTTSLVAIIGAAGLAVGLALQGTLSNVAAGVMIILFRPFRVGDYVEIGGEGGTVRGITLNWTELATLDNCQLIIPNSEVWGNTITNYTFYETRRAEWEFGVSYSADLALAEKVIRDTLMADARSLTDPEPFVQVNELGDSSVNFIARVWVKTEDYFVYQADMKRAVKEALDAAGIDIPFPTRTIVQV